MVTQPQIQSIINKLGYNTSTTTTTSTPTVSTILLNFSTQHLTVLIIDKKRAGGFRFSVFLPNYSFDLTPWFSWKDDVRKPHDLGSLELIPRSLVFRMSAHAITKHITTINLSLQDQALIDWVGNLYLVVDIRYL